MKPVKDKYKQQVTQRIMSKTEELTACDQSGRERYEPFSDRHDHMHTN